MKVEYKEKVLNSVEGVNKRLDRLSKIANNEIPSNHTEVLNLLSEIKKLMEVVEGIIDIS